MDPNQHSHCTVFRVLGNLVLEQPGVEVDVEAACVRRAMGELPRRCSSRWSARASIGPSASSASTSSASASSKDSRRWRGR